MKKNEHKYSSVKGTDNNKSNVSSDSSLDVTDTDPDQVVIGDGSIEKKGSHSWWMVIPLSAWFIFGCFLLLKERKKR